MLITPPSPRGSRRADLPGPSPTTGVPTPSPTVASRQEAWKPRGGDPRQKLRPGAEAKLARRALVGAALGRLNPIAELRALLVETEG